MSDQTSNAFQFTFHGIDGGEIRLADYTGKALLVVNTASQCGFTPQYQGLEQVWQDWKDRDVMVLGVPSNDFNQETGNDKDIKEFCDLKFHVTFPMTAKTPVTGDDAHPFYRWIADEAGLIGRPHWNFYKYVIDRNGQLVAWYSSLTRPTNKAVASSLERALTPT